MFISRARYFLFVCARDDLQNTFVDFCGEICYKKQNKYTVISLIKAAPAF